jgi:HPt (histidine-containing phosphotransfer) domain-containing protein
MAVDLTRFVELYVSESCEHLSLLSRGLLALERGDPAGLDEAFRAAHTIKGLSATMGYAREHPTAAFGFGDALDASHQRSCPQVDASFARDPPDVLGGALHQPDQAVVDLLLAPEELLGALHPFEIGDGDPAGVGEDVRHDGDAALPQDAIGHDAGRPVRRFDHEHGLDATGVLFGDLILYGGRNQHVAGQLEKLLIAHGLDPWHSLQDPVRLEPTAHLGQIEPARSMDTSAHVGDPNDLSPLLGGDLGRRSAHVAVALHDDARLVDG